MSQDINYVEFITAALQTTVNEDNEVHWDLFLSAERETIINSYCGTPLNVFKGTWKRRFKEVTSSLNFRIKNDSGDTNNWQTLIYDELKVKRKTSSISASTTTSTKSTESVHNNSISADDKKKGIVMQAINDSTFEHSCLSYIVDLADPIWPNYVSPEETDEVRTYNSVELPDLQDEIQNCIHLYDNNTLKTAADYYEFASDQKLKFTKLGERTSVSSALGKNEGRSLEFRERKVIGAKVDIPFKKITDEVGCAEVGKHDVLVIDDKYLDDGLNLELLIMNVPARKTVTRITRTKKLPFPSVDGKLGKNN
ncbi:hypothetical protein G6F24_001872 [Rhizopus arrhizus]|nr:hypothetical protein G6F24_001872 [Rhizopus arrhizus]